MSRSLDRWFQDIITAEKRRVMRSGITSAVSTAESIRKGIHRVPGLSEVNAQADALGKKPLHHYVFCTHEVPYWRTCAKCGRDHARAQRNADLILHSSQKLVK